MRVTLRDVAQLAGVSPATVSLVLNERSEGRVSEELAARVRNAAATLKYRPNLLARSLRTQETRTFGLISRDIATTPFAGAMLAGAQHIAWQRNSLLLFVNSDGDLDHERTEVASLIQRQVDGFMLGAMYHQKVEIPENLQDQRLVLLDCVDGAGRYDSVVPDEYQGAHDAVALLVSMGHRRIAHVTTTDQTIAATERLRAYRDVLQAAGLGNEMVVRCEGGEAQGGFAAMQQILRGPALPTAIFCYTDRMAMGVMDAAREAGLRIPADLSIMGFDNQPYLADAMRPALTTINLPHYEMGVWAASRLIPHSDSQDSEPAGPTQVKAHCAVVMRDSVAPPGT